MTRNGHGYGILVVLAVYIIAGDCGTFLQEHQDGRGVSSHLHIISLKEGQHGPYQKEACPSST